MTGLRIRAKCEVILIGQQEAVFISSPCGGSGAEYCQDCLVYRRLGPGLTEEIVRRAKEKGGSSERDEARVNNTPFYHY